MRDVACEGGGIHLSLSEGVNLHSVPRRFRTSTHQQVILGNTEDETSMLLDCTCCVQG